MKRTWNEFVEKSLGARFYQVVGCGFVSRLFSQFDGKLGLRKENLRPGALEMIILKVYLVDFF